MAISDEDLLISAANSHSFFSFCTREKSAFIKYAPLSALTSSSSVTSWPFLNLSSWCDDNKILVLSRPSWKTILAFKASLGSARSTIVALSAYIPIFESESNSFLLYASAKLLVFDCIPSSRPHGKMF